MNNSKIVIAALVMGLAVLISLYISSHQREAMLKKQIAAQDVLIERYEAVHRDMTQMLQYRDRIKDDVQLCYKSLKQLRQQYEAVQQRLSKDDNNGLNFTELLGAAEGLRDNLVACNGNLSNCQKDLQQSLDVLTECQFERKRLLGASQQTDL